MKDLIEKTNKKTLILIGGFLILILIIIFGGALLYNKLFYKVSYEEAENIMKKASIEYLKNKPEKLPKNINDSITITEKTLVNAEYMKKINDLVKDENNNCEGQVTVTNINGNYRYNPILDCGNKYQTTKFIDYINKNVSTTETGNGLYNLNNELVYRGDNVNNYIKLSNKTYRIVKFKDEYTVLILTEKLENYSWDDRYNIEKNSNLGINDYPVSRIKDYLTTLYKNNTLINENDKLLVASHNLQIGKRTTNDTDKTGSLENSTILENQYISLLPAYDYLNASLDSNCKTTTSASCTNYNYLSNYKLNWWLATANQKTTYQVYKVNNHIVLSNASNTGYIRPVIYLTPDTIYVSGKGTQQNPYIVR